MWWYVVNNQIDQVGEKTRELTAMWAGGRRTKPKNYDESTTKAPRTEPQENRRGCK